MASRIFGSGIKRREDPRLITGQAKYTDDLSLPGMAHLAVVRSPYAHAKIKSLNTKKAENMPGVLGVYARADFTRQLTYNDRPLYYYVDDRKAGDLTGDRVTDEWGRWLAVPLANP